MKQLETLFLLPGLMCDESVWAQQKKLLAPYAEIKIPVFRDFNSLTAMAEFVIEQAPERFSVVGHSMGGRVGLEIMALAGNRIDKFAVMDTGTHGVLAGEVEKRQVLLDLADQHGLQAVADEWVLPMIHPSRHGDQALVTAITDMILRNTVEGYKGQVKALLDRQDRTNLLASIQQEVLLVCGDADSWSPVSQHEAMQSELPRSNLVVIKDSGHMCTMEKPGEVGQVLLDWFRQ